MADEAQIIYEYVNGSTVSFKTDDLKIQWNRLYMSITSRPDGKIYVDDPAKAQRVFTFSSMISGATLNTMNTVQTGAITYSGDYPRIQKIYFAGATTLTNIEVAITSFEAEDLGNEFWNVKITMTEKTD
jgi:hypothetical protein